jgi:hypothetical protein
MFCVPGNPACLPLLLSCFFGHGNRQLRPNHVIELLESREEQLDGDGGGPRPREELSAGSREDKNGRTRAAMHFRQFSKGESKLGSEINETSY